MTLLSLLALWLIAGLVVALLWLAAFGPADLSDSDDWTSPS